MSDHVDGPRQIGDLPADLTDLFAFTSPENPSRTVLGANVCASEGQSLRFVVNNEKGKLHVTNHRCPRR